MAGEGLRTPEQREVEAMGIESRASDHTPREQTVASRVPTQTVYLSAKLLSPLLSS